MRTGQKIRPDTLVWAFKGNDRKSLVFERGSRMLRLFCTFAVRNPKDRFSRVNIYTSSICIPISGLQVKTVLLSTNDNLSIQQAYKMSGLRRVQQCKRSECYRVLSL